MKKSRFTEEQVVAILREADQAPIPEVARTMALMSRREQLLAKNDLRTRDHIFKTELIKNAARARYRPVH